MLAFTNETQIVLQNIAPASNWKGVSNTSIKLDLKLYRLINLPISKLRWNPPWKYTYTLTSFTHKTVLTLISRYVSVRFIINSNAIFIFDDKLSKHNWQCLHVSLVVSSGHLGFWIQTVRQREATLTYSQSLFLMLPMLSRISKAVFLRN